MSNIRTQEASNDLDRLASMTAEGRAEERAEYVAERQPLMDAKVKFLAEVPARFTGTYTRPLSGIEQRSGVSREYTALHWGSDLGDRNLNTNPEYVMYRTFEAGLAWLTARIESISQDINAIDYTNELESGFDGD